MVLSVRADGQPSKPFYAGRQNCGAATIPGLSTRRIRMDKLKFVLLMLFFVILIGLFGWGSWTFFRMLGFWQSAAVILGVGLFFSARGSYLVFGVAVTYIEEARALRLLREARIIPATDDDQKPLKSLNVRRLNKKFVAFLFLFFLTGVCLLFYFSGFWKSFICLVLISQAFTVGSNYYLRGKIVSYHVELENQRLTFGRGEK